MKKIRLDMKPTFRKKSHEIQYHFVRDKLNSAAAALGQTSPVVEEKAVLKEGEKSLMHGRKN